MECELSGLTGSDRVAKLQQSLSGFPISYVLACIDKDAASHCLAHALGWIALAGHLGVFIFNRNKKEINNATHVYVYFLD